MCFRRTMHQACSWGSWNMRKVDMGRKVWVFLVHHKAHVDVARNEKVFFSRPTPPPFQLLYVEFAILLKNGTPTIMGNFFFSFLWYGMGAHWE
jgi:hypothetical protein